MWDQLPALTLLPDIGSQKPNRIIMKQKYLVLYTLLLFSLFLNACSFGGKIYPPERTVKNLKLNNSNSWQPKQAANSIDIHSLKIPQEQNVIKGYVSFEKWLKQTNTYYFAILSGDTLLWSYAAHPGADSLLIECFSLTKWIIATLVGSAVEDKVLALDSSIVQYLPQLSKAGKGLDWNEVTLRHLMTHSSGVAPGGNGPHIAYWLAGDLGKKIRHSKLKMPVATQHVYSPANYQIVVEALEKATGKSIEDYFVEKLGKPLDWGPAKWRCDNQGQAFGFAGFIAHPMDIAKLARIFLQDGKWNEQQIIPSGWVKQAISSAQARYGRPDITPGHLYIDPSTSGNFHTVGYTGHMVYASPKDDLLLIRFSEKNVKDDNTLRDQMRYLLEQVILLIKEPIKISSNK